MRLEIESKKDRDYFNGWWHHIEKPASVGFADQKYQAAPSDSQMADRTWFYDAAQKNLHLRIHVKAKEDAIIVIEF